MKTAQKCTLLFFVISIIFYLFLNLYKMNAISLTLDEINDLRIVRCLLITTDPFKCTFDICQTRLPYYIHSIGFVLLAPILKQNIHHYISLIFGLLNIIIIYMFIKREFNLELASITLLLMVISIPLLTSSRMLLTHSNIIFCTFTILTVTFFYYFIKKNNLKILVLSSIFFGLSVGSNLLGVFNFIFLLTFYLLACEKKDLYHIYAILIPVSIITFFASSIIYFKPINFFGLIDSTLHGHSYHYWNFFNMGTNTAPWWFSFSIFFVKITPWWLFFFLGGLILTAKKFVLGKKDLNSAFLFSLAVFIISYLFIKSGIFHYDAPHHQVHLYPFVYVIIACAIFEIYKKARSHIKVVFVILLSIFVCYQVIQIFQFAPNLLFYGAQYGDDFVGEFYGPAVLQCQDVKEIRAILKNIGKKEKVLMQDHTCPTAVGGIKGMVKFSNRDRNKKYKYAFIDYLYGHLSFSDRKRYEEYVYQNCEKIYSYKFPGGFDVYCIYRCN